jgi:hypothetical protein
VGVGVAEAKTPVSVDTAGGFARVVFELPQKPGAKAELTYDVVILSFDQPVDVDTETVRQALGPYASIVKQDADGKTVRIAMNGQIRLLQSGVGRQFAVDLVPLRYAGEVPPFMGTPNLDPASAESLNPVPVPSEARERADITTFAAPAKLLPVNVHAGELPTLSRVSVEWPGPVDYRFEQNDDIAILRFGTAGRVDLSELRIAPPRYVKSARAELTSDSLTLLFDLNSGVRAESFRDGNTIVLDIKPPPPAQVAASTLPSAPADDRAAILEAAAHVSEALAEHRLTPPGPMTEGGDARAVLSGQSDATPLPVAAPATETEAKPAPAEVAQASSTPDATAEAPQRRHSSPDRLRRRSIPMA